MQFIRVVFLCNEAVLLRNLYFRVLFSCSLVRLNTMSSRVTWYQVASMSEVYDISKLQLVEAQLNSKYQREKIEELNNRPPKVCKASRNQLLLELDTADNERRKIIRNKLAKIHELSKIAKKVVGLNAIIRDLKIKCTNMEEDLKEKMSEVSAYNQPRTVQRVADFSLIKKYKDWKKVDISVRGFGEKSKGDLQRFEDVSTVLKIKIPEILKRNVGLYLKKPNNKKFSDDGENLILRYGLSTVQGWRSTMDAAHAAYLNFNCSASFFGVYDGHGGKAVSKFCAKHLHLEMLKNDDYLAGDIVTSARKAFRRMDVMLCCEKGRRELALLAGDDLEGPSEAGEANSVLGGWPDHASVSEYRGPNAGTTACVAVIHDNKVVVANVGNSRCVLSRKGQAFSLTKDHTPELVEEKERILSAGGFIKGGCVNGTLNVTRAIGDIALKRNRLLPGGKQIITAEPDIRSFKLSNEEDFIIIACDGIWDVLSSQQAVSFVHTRMNMGTCLSDICKSLFDKCISSGEEEKGRENMTMIIVKFKKKPCRSR